MRKGKLSNKQIERLSEIYGNIGVAWIAAGTIAFIFVKPFKLVDFLYSSAVSLAMRIVFIGLSLYVLRRNKI